jgi:hypothetical protein
MTRRRFHAQITGSLRMPSTDDSAVKQKISAILPGKLLHWFLKSQRVEKRTRNIIDSLSVAPLQPHGF